MKKISFIIAALALINLSSCFVEVHDGVRYHHPFWHHREAVEIRGENNGAKQQNPVTDVTYATRNIKKSNQD